MFNDLKTCCKSKRTHLRSSVINPGLKKSTRPLVFTSKIRVRASEFFILLIRLGKWYFQSQ